MMICASFCQNYYNKTDEILEGWRIPHEIAPDEMANIAERRLVSAIAIHPCVPEVDVDGRYLTEMPRISLAVPVDALCL